MSLSLQETYFAEGHCFGCGPANPKGLHVQSHPQGDEVICHWHPEKHHEAFDGVVNGGIIGAIFDCHANWTAAWHLMKRTKAARPPCTVTSEFHVKLKRPTPSTGEIILTARVLESQDDRAVIAAELSAGGKICAEFQGTFVAVKQGHPAWHRW